MFSRVNPLGWALFEELTSAQMNLLDLNASRAIDGTFGGTYNPSSPININGTLNVTNMVFTGGTVTNLTVTTTLDTNIINCNEINIASEMTCDGTALFNDTIYDYDTFNFVGAGKNFNFLGNGTFDFSNGIFLVHADGIARFDSDVDFTNVCVVVVQATCDWTFNNWPVFQGGFRAYGSVIFNSIPSFTEGLTLAAGKLINYSTVKSFVIRWPFSLGGFANDTNISSYYRMKSGKICQIANSAPGFYSQMHPGLSGGTTFNVTQAEFRCRGNGLSGTTVGPTLYELNMFDENMGFLEQKLAYDNDPNSATAHGATWIAGGAPLVVDPNSNILGIMFNGYNGGDTLNGTTKWYELLSCRMTCSAMAMGVF